MEIILASGSPRRTRLLREAGLEHRIVIPHVSEDAGPDASPEAAAVHAARRKYDHVSARHPGAVVVAADTLVVLDDRAMGKPRDLGEAEAMLRALSGRTHFVLTAVCIGGGSPRRRVEFTDRSCVVFGELDSRRIARYLDQVHVLDKAGAYAIQEHADLLSARVEGSFHNVVGLPLHRVLRALEGFGIPKDRRIGSLFLDSPFVLGGLAGYGDVHFRTLCRSFGAAAVVTPIHLDQALIAFVKRGRPKPPVPGPGEHPVLGQILGSEPAEMAEGARILASQGFDGIDVNFACPVPKVLRRRRGGQLLTDPDRAISIVSAVLAAVDVPVTCKIRRGFDGGSESEAAFWRILEGTLAAGVHGITIHPRTVLQRFRGPSDWAVLTEARRKFPGALLLGSGDLFEAEDGIRMLDETGIDAVTFARGAVGDPWIFRQALSLWHEIPPPRPGSAERARWLEEYAEGLFSSHREKRALTQLRKHGVKAARRFPRVKHFRSIFASIGSRPEAERAIETLKGTDGERD